jgi:WD40 repeat protein
MLRSWATTTVGERMKEGLTLRLHGRPSWMLDSASLSTDGKQILSVRSDGQLVLWDIDGTRRQELTLPHFPLGASNRFVALAEDGTVFTWSRTTTDRQGRTPLIVSTLFPERKRFEVLLEARGRAAPGTDHVYLYATRPKLYLLYLKRSPSSIVSARSGEVAAEVPVTAAVSALSMSEDGTILGIAQLGSLELWRLAPGRGRLQLAERNRYRRVAPMAPAWKRGKRSLNVSTSGTKRTDGEAGGLQGRLPLFRHQEPRRRLAGLVRTPAIGKWPSG